MLSQLLSQFAPDSYVVLTDRFSTFAGLPAHGWLPAHHYFLGNGRRYSALDASTLATASSRGLGRADRGLVSRLVHPIFEDVGALRKVREVTRSAVRTIKDEEPDIVLAVSGDPIFLVGAARAARATGKPLYVHLFDLFAGNRYSPPKRLLARRHERDILTSARRVFVPNEAMAAYYSDRLGISPVVIPNGTTIPSYDPGHAVRQVTRPSTILYTGAVYWAQRDSVQNLMVALRQLPGVKFEARTSASKRELALAGLHADHLAASFSSQEAAVKAQRSADILFLPLAFRTSAPDVIRTAFPAKAAEYLVSGTPILVHAPPDAYISQYARRKNWGYVVDTPDPNALAAAIRMLLDDTDLRRSLVTHAFEEARRAHDFQQIGPEYLRYFS
jgi:glycosyltransferase involved in cell wall biosynthesis